VLVVAWINHQLSANRQPIAAGAQQLMEPEKFWIWFCFDETAVSS